MNLLRSSKVQQLDQEPKIYYQSLSHCNKTLKKPDLYGTPPVRYEALDAPTLRIVGKTPNIQFLDCVTVTVCPAIVTVPVREIPGFSVTRKVTEPFPLPTSEP